MTALAVLGALLLEDGRRWADAAFAFQLEDAHAILAGERPYHYLTRPRGASKTTDLAAVALALLLAAGSRERLYWLAADRDQGQLAIDAIVGFCDRTPAIGDAVTLPPRPWRSRRRVLASTCCLRTPRPRGACARRPCSATSSRNGRTRRSHAACGRASHRRWPSEPTRSSSCSVPPATRPTSRGASSTTRSTHSMWRVHEVPGPTPWLDSERLAEQRERLVRGDVRAAVYERLDGR